ncbi:HAD family phosphatase [Agrobacterium sp. AGB01]|uniref:HAD family hydrolase n=1 Tax=Agrobacterium sp. AGB01 TaxID=2769302 RepID=UPI00177FE766|nr:HAD family phosphatase [Agrobacterium sp. AGB01]MBD9390396.1 HAD family phosphatase [Agrobacterium sp. AGB01]
MALQFSGVLLDLDGLLLDTERLQFEVGPAVLKGMGFEVAPTFFHALVGVDRATGARMISKELGGDIDGAALDRAWNEAMDERMRDAIPLRPGVHDFLDMLDEQQLPRAIATNSETDRAKWKLQHAGLLHRMNAVIGVDMVKRGKPAPDIYVMAAETLGLRPEQCVALDDSDLGVRAAIDAGVGKVIQIPDMVMSRDLYAHHQAGSLQEATSLMGF